MTRARSPVKPRQSRAGLRAAVAALAASVCWIAAAAHAAAPRGFIVELKDAPLHADAARETALNAGRDDVSGVQRERLQRVAKWAGADAANVRPQGRAAHVLDFGRALSAADAERIRPSGCAGIRPWRGWHRTCANGCCRCRRTTPGFPAPASQWWLHPVAGSDGNAIGQRLRGVPGFQRGWMQTTGAAGARVAVLDTGITSHPELTGRVVGGYDFVSDVSVANDGNGRDADPSDPGDWVSGEDVKTDDFRDCTVEPSSWHGTLIAGIVAARTNEGVGVAAANWDGRIVPVRVAGKCGADVHDITDGMRWAAGLAVAGAPAPRIRTRRASSTSASVAAPPAMPPTRARSTTCAPPAQWWSPRRATNAPRRPARPTASV